jgi:predicted nucleic acid-binding protein
VIVDTSALLAYFDANEPTNQACAEAIESSSEDLVVSPYVIAELDYLIARRVGVEAEIAAIRQLASGAWELPALTETDLESAARLIARYADQDIGIADASNVVLAARYRTRTIATLDRRHLGVLRPLTGGRFTVVP